METLQMSEFSLECSPQSCFELVRVIRDMNAQIDGLLSHSGDWTSDQVDEIEGMVQRRGTLLDELRRQSMQVFADADAEQDNLVRKFWNSFGSELLGSDEKRLALLKSRVDLAAGSIRSTMNNKSLLQYHRG